MKGDTPVKSLLIAAALLISIACSKRAEAPIQQEMAPLVDLEPDAPEDLLGQEDEPTRQSNLRSIEPFLVGMYDSIEWDINLKGRVKEINFNRISLGNTEKNDKPLDDILSNIESYEMEHMFKYSYSRSGFRTKYVDIRRTTVESPFIIYTYQFDDMGRLERIKQIWDDENREYDSLFLFHYNSEGQLVLIEDRDLSGNLGEKMAMEYHPLLDFTVVEKLTCLTKALSCRRDSYLLDAEGRVIEEMEISRMCVHYNHKKTIRLFDYSYNENGTLASKHAYNSSGSSFLREAYSYNGHGDMTASTRYGPDGEVEWVEKNEYVYDENGNWVKNLATDEHHEHYKKVWDQRWLFMREIEYYEGS